MLITATTEEAIAIKYFFSKKNSTFAKRVYTNTKNNPTTTGGTTRTDAKYLRDPKRQTNSGANKQTSETKHKTKTSSFLDTLLIDLKSFCSIFLYVKGMNTVLMQDVTKEIAMAILYARLYSPTASSLQNHEIITLSL